LILLALGAVGLTYASARALVRSGRVSPRIVPIATAAAVGLGLLVVVANFPARQFVPGTVVAGGRSIDETAPVFLRGTYMVSWTADPSGAGSCPLEVALYRAADNVKVKDLVSVVASDTNRAASLPEIEGLPGADYKLKAVSSCDWRVTFSPG